jgi:hypothetical protein
MDAGVRSPLIDFFRRGEVANDVRLLAAQGALAPRAQEQLALLLLLADDPDPLVARTAASTIDQLPPASVARFIGRLDVPPQMRDFFTARGIQPEAGAAEDDDQPLVDTSVGESEGAQAAERDPQILSMLPVIDRMKLAMKGTREQRAQLIRDSNKLVAISVLSSPKLNDAEIEAFARMANLTEDVLRVIATNRAWVKNYNVAAALTRNPKTPPALAMNFLHRLNERDLKKLAFDRNVSEPVRLAARKFATKGER